MSPLHETATTTRLLAGLADPGNAAVWAEFDARYRPILVGFGRRLGLGDDDAQEAAQETMAQFVRDYRAGGYDRARGRLRAWILGIARHRIIDVGRRAARHPRRGTSALGELPDDATLTIMWDEECRQAVLRAALAELSTRGRMAPKTVQAFHMQVDEQRDPTDVARLLGMSVRAVYLAKHRCLERLRQIIDEITPSYELT